MSGFFKDKPPIRTQAYWNKKRKNPNHVIRRVIIAIAVNTNGVVKRINVLENEFLSMVEITYFKAVKSFPLDE